MPGGPQQELITFSFRGVFLAVGDRETGLKLGEQGLFCSIIYFNPFVEAGLWSIQATLVVLCRPLLRTRWSRQPSYRDCVIVALWSKQACSLALFTMCLFNYRNDSTLTSSGLSPKGGYVRYGDGVPGMGYRLRFQRLLAYINHCKLIPKDLSLIHI